MAKKKKSKKKRESLKKSTNPKIRSRAEQIADKDKAKANKNKTATKTKLSAKQTGKKKSASKSSKAKKDAASKTTYGSFGSAIKFAVNDPYNDKGKRLIRVPSQIQRESRARWTTYNLLGRKPKKAFEGPEAAQVTLSITLDADHGVNPRSTLDKIRQAIEKGTVNNLIIGGKVVGKYYIESMAETWDRFFLGGGVTHATGEIIFAEYR